MKPTTFQLARRLNAIRATVTGQRCPCGNKAVKKDGASWVCAECLRRDQVVHELNAQAETFFEHARLEDDEFRAARKRRDLMQWRSKRAKRTKNK